MIDANFRLRCKARGINDIELGPGWAFYVEEMKYLAHVQKFAKQPEVRNSVTLLMADTNALIRRTCATLSTTLFSELA